MPTPPAALPAAALPAAALPAADLPASDPAPIVAIKGLAKTYASGFQALRGVDLAIRRGEIFALLGPNGAGKTTLISVVCGLVTASAGTVTVDGHDHARDYRAARSLIGLVPQELTTDAFETVWNTVSFSRGLFGLRSKPAHIERVLRDLSLWDKRDAKIMALSGGMKRRVLIAKALSHEPRILFLDEPTAGVDVELRRDMWRLVRQLREAGTTIILTTHYLEEAEELADRIGVINHGRLVLVDDKATLLARLGTKQLRVLLAEPVGGVPQALAAWHLSLGPDGRSLVHAYEGGQARVVELLGAVQAAGLSVADVETHQSSLEDIFVGLVHGSQDGGQDGGQHGDEAAA